MIKMARSGTNIYLIASPEEVRLLAKKKLDEIDDGSNIDISWVKSLSDNTAGTISSFAEAATYAEQLAAKLKEISIV